MSSSDFSKVRGFKEKRWLGRCVSCPALIPCSKTEDVEDVFFFRSSTDGSESPIKKIRTSREDE